MLRAATLLQWLLQISCIKTSILSCSFTCNKLIMSPGTPPFCKKTINSWIYIEHIQVYQLWFEHSLQNKKLRTSPRLLEGSRDHLSVHQWMHCWSPYCTSASEALWTRHCTSHPCPVSKVPKHPSQLSKGGWCPLPALSSTFIPPPRGKSPPLSTPPSTHPSVRPRGVLPIAISPGCTV